MLPHQSHYRLADDVISHLDTVMSSLADPWISTRYTGFLSVTAVTVFELAIKDIFREFARKKHPVFGKYADSQFNRINGRIKNDNLKNDYIKAFGEKYLKRYKKKIDEIENDALRNEGVSVKAAYANLINWRNDFAHEGVIPSTATYQEVVKSYELGKRIIDCVEETMRR